MNTIITKSVCVVCGSQNAELKETSTSTLVPYAPHAAVYTQKAVCCQDCGAEIDETSDDEIKAALESARQESIVAMLDYFKREGYSQAAIERSLDLPQRTIARWKVNGELSSVGMALLRIIRTYPWILDVAERKYEPAFALQTLLVNAAHNMAAAVSNRFQAGASQASMGVICVSKTESENACFMMKYSTQTVQNAESDQSQLLEYRVA
jgi:hypothetical protein